MRKKQTIKRANSDEQFVDDVWWHITRQGNSDIDYSVLKEEEVSIVEEVEPSITLDDLFSKISFADFSFDDLMLEMSKEDCEDVIEQTTLADIPDYDLFGNYERTIFDYEEVVAGHYTKHTTIPFFEGAFHKRGHDTFIGENLVSKGILPQLETRDWVKTASDVGEIANCKGTSQGYSLLLHSAACIALQDTLGGILETENGVDLSSPSFDVEVSGMNFYRRRTKAQLCVNKYAIFQLFCVKTDFSIFVAEMSWAEDNGDANSLNNTSISQPPSLFTETIRSLSDYTRSLSSVDYKHFGCMLTDYYSKGKIPDAPQFSEEIDFKFIESVFNKFCRKSPAPYRFELDYKEDFDPQMLKIRAKIDIKSYDTSFRNMDQFYDFKKYMYMPSKTMPETIYDISYEYDLIKSTMLKFNLFQTIYAEGDLFSKINGSAGWFFSSYHKIGISWLRRKDRSSYTVSYYSQNMMPEYCGKWRKACWQDDEQNIKKTFFVSPCFTLNNAYIQYSRALPGKLITIFTSLLSEVGPKSGSFVIKIVLDLASIMRWSSWQTSRLLGDTRFFVMCSIAGSGNRKNMINKVFSRVEEQPSFPDYVVMMMFDKYSKSYSGEPCKYTPLMKLPVRLLSIEKDLPLYVMWHIRGKQHSTRCFKKMKDNQRLEQKQNIESKVFLETQLEFFKKHFENGTSSEDFDVLMNAQPKFPHYNHVFFVGCVGIAAPNLMSRKNVSAPGPNIQSLIKDNQSFIETKDTFVTGKLADCLRESLKRYNNPTSIHQYWFEMIKGPHIKQVFLMHPKDSKSKDREIPQMSVENRCLQSMTQNACRDFTTPDATDMMEDPEKFTKYIEDFSEIMKGRGFTRSEDKENFCGFFTPECMGLAVQSVGRAIGSTQMITAAAMLMQDTQRIVIEPDGHIMNEEDELIEWIDVNVNHGGKRTKKLKSMVCLRNMGQGVRQAPGAVINTIFTNCISILQNVDMKPKRKKQVTTADDACRAIQKRSAPLGLSNDFYNGPCEYMKSVMLKDSKEKAIESSHAAEFNNIACGPNGMFTQAPVYASLVVQPLNAEHLAADAMRGFANARSALSWGESVDVAYIASCSNIEQLACKWLLEPEDIRTLINHGLIGNSMEELVGGVPCFSEKMKSFLYDAIKPKLRDSVDRHECSVMIGVRKYSVKHTYSGKEIDLLKKKKKTSRSIPEFRESFLINEKFKQVSDSRKMGGKVKDHFVRPKAYNMLKAVSRRFLDHFNEHVISEYNKDVYEKSPDVTILGIPRKSSHQRPMKIGKFRNKPDEPNLNKVHLYKEKNLKFFNELTEVELNMSKLQGDEYITQRNKLIKRNNLRGLRVKMPGGLPKIRFDSKGTYPGPTSCYYIIDFNEELDEMKVKKRSIVLGGVSYRNIMPCLWSGSMTRKAITEQQSHNKKLILACGFEIQNDSITMFYKRKQTKFEKENNKNPPLECLTVGYGNDRVIIANRPEYKVFCPIKIDKSPIKKETIGKCSIKGEPWIDASDSFHINYGNYINSSSKQARDMLNQFYAKFDSQYDINIHYTKQTYPIFCEGSTKMAIANTVNINGFRSARKLQFINERSENYTLDCTGDVPFVCADVSSEEEWLE